MTALGKTLVFFILLFSLVTGGLIVMAFLTRTNWRIGMEAAMQETKAAQAALKQEQATSTQRKAEFENIRKKLEEEIVELKKQNQTKDAEIANQKAQANSSQRDAAEQLVVSQAGSVEIQKLQLERNQLSVNLAERNNQLVKVNVDLANTTSQMTFFKLRSERLERENSQLNESLATMRRRFEELRAQAGPVRGGAQPNQPRVPTVETTGQITSADGNIAVASLGSDNGIEKGHILQVYRMSPNPIYLGTMTVTEAHAHRSVGIFEPAGRGKSIAKGDTVDTKILR